MIRRRKGAKSEAKNTLAQLTETRSVRTTVGPAPKPDVRQHRSNMQMKGRAKCEDKDLP